MALYSFFVVVIALQCLFMVLGHPLADSDTIGQEGRFSVPVYYNNASSGRLIRRTTSDASSHYKFPTNAWSPISIGGQQVAVVLDTGSSDFWVHTTKEDPKSYYGGVGNTSFYNPDKNPHSFQSIPNSNFSISYGGDSSYGFSGPLGSDLVSLGTTKGVRTAFGLVPDTYESKDLDGVGYQGILGLPNGDGAVSSKPKQKTWLENVLPTLDEKLFTVTVTSDGHGKWNFGYIDEAQYSGSIHNVPFGKCGSWWTVNQLAVTWKGLGRPYEQTTQNCIIVDSGTDEIILDSHIVEAYYSLVPKAQQGQGNNGYYYFPCTSQLPDLTMTIGENYTTKVSGDHMNTGPTSWDPKLCAGALVNMTNAPAVLGHHFFKSHFVVFDYGHQRMGFAEVAT